MVRAVSSIGTAESGNGLDRCRCSSCGVDGANLTSFRMRPGEEFRETEPLCHRVHFGRDENLFPMSSLLNCLPDDFFGNPETVNWRRVRSD